MRNRLELQHLADFSFSVIQLDVTPSGPTKPDPIVSEEIPSNHWRLNICLDGLIVVRFPAYLNSDLFITVTIKLGTVHCPEECSWKRFIIFVRWPGSDLTATVAQKVLFAIGIKKMRTYVHSQLAWRVSDGLGC